MINNLCVNLILLFVEEESDFIFYFLICLIKNVVNISFLVKDIVKRFIVCVWYKMEEKGIFF